MKKIIIVGAGLSGATVARILAEKGHSVFVFDKRDTIGGNAYDFTDKNGIIVQPYGPHIFHTDSKEVFDFLSEFTEWKKYEHRVLANVKGKLVPVPFNLTSLFELYPKDKAERIKDVLLSEFKEGEKVPVLKLKEHESAEIREFGDFVYKNIFYIYTTKQWGCKPEELGDTVMNRVPVYLSEEDRYFTDKYQFMPSNGFTPMIENILKHPNIKIHLGADAKKRIALQDGKIYLDGNEYDGVLVYTGCVDELFDYKFGVLPYRSLKFKFKTKRASSFQKSAVVNYTTSAKYTRISEFTKFTCEPTKKTVIVKEYPKKYKKSNGGVPYYPIPLDVNLQQYAKYEDEAKRYNGLYLIGRLANYKYINMDVAVKNAIALAKKIIKENPVSEKHREEVEMEAKRAKAKQKKVKTDNEK